MSSYKEIGDRVNELRGREFFSTERGWDEEGLRKVAKERWNSVTDLEGITSRYWTYVFSKPEGYFTILDMNSTQWDIIDKIFKHKGEFKSINFPPAYAFEFVRLPNEDIERCRLFFASNPKGFNGLYYKVLGNQILMQDVTAWHSAQNS